MFFRRPSGTCPEAVGRVPRHVRMALACLPDPSGPPKTHQNPNWKFSFFCPPTQRPVHLNAAVFLQKQGPNEQSWPGHEVSNINTWRKSGTGSIWSMYLCQLAPFSTNVPTYVRRYLTPSFPRPLYYSSSEKETFCSTSHYGCMYISF